MNIIKTNRRALQSGTTLVELSVVIAVILLLVGVLFIAVDGWKKSANRAACIVNIATLQKAVRSYANANIDSNPTAYSLAILNTAGYFPTANGPQCPSAPTTAASYTPSTAGAGNLPLATGTVAFSCVTTGLNHAPAAASTANW